MYINADNQRFLILIVPLPSIFFSLDQGSRQVTDAAQLEQLINEGKEAAAFLRTAIVQATANDKGHIGKKLELLVI